MRERFRLRLFLIMIVFATVVAFTIAIIDHLRITERVKEDNEFQMRDIQDRITQTLDTIDKIYYYFDGETASRMEENSRYILDLYEENPSFDEWDFDSLKEELGMDIYIINKENVITHSSVSNDIGMDFKKCCGKLVPVLDERRASGEFFHDGLDIEQHTGQVKKFSYMATRDKNYLVELGYNLEDGDIFQEFNIFNVTDDLENNYSKINEINVLTLGGNPLGTSVDEWTLPPKRREAFEKTLATGETTEVDMDWKEEPATYRYIAHVSEYDSGVTQNKVVEIAYNEHEIQKILDKNRQIFFIQLLTILVVTVIVSLIISHWMSKPIYMAFHDSLTGLRNRAGFSEDLHAAIHNTKGTTGVFMVDLDNFKLVNDHLGHDRGDELLKMAARTIREAVPKEGRVFRMGGDEFSIVLPDTTKQQTKEIAELIISRLGKSIDRVSEIKELNVTASIGIALAPEHGEDVDGLYKKSDIALYKSKQLGKNQYHMYEPK